MHVNLIFTIHVERNFILYLYGTTNENKQGVKWYRLINYITIYIYQKINNKKRKEKWNNIIIDLIPCLSFANSCFYLNFHHISEYTKIVQDSNRIKRNKELTMINRIMYKDEPILSKRFPFHTGLETLGNNLEQTKENFFPLSPPPPSLLPPPSPPLPACPLRNRGVEKSKKRDPGVFLRWVEAFIRYSSVAARNGHETQRKKRKNPIGRSLYRYFSDSGNSLSLVKRGEIKQRRGIPPPLSFENRRLKSMERGISITRSRHRIATCL